VWSRAGGWGLRRARLSAARASTPLFVTADPSAGRGAPNAVKLQVIVRGQADDRASRYSGTYPSATLGQIDRDRDEAEHATQRTHGPALSQPCDDPELSRLR